jgi:hypothetical protein
MLAAKAVKRDRSAELGATSQWHAGQDPGRQPRPLSLVRLRERIGPLRRSLSQSSQQAECRHRDWASCSGAPGRPTADIRTADSPKAARAPPRCLLQSPTLIFRTRRTELEV